jgi:hypothetical protein
MPCCIIGALLFGWIFRAVRRRKSDAGVQAPVATWRSSAASTVR